MWPDIPNEIFALILLRLGLADLACIAIVCKTWRLAISWFATDHGLAPRHLPWLVPSRRFNPRPQISALLRPSGPPRPNRRRCIGVHDQCLVIADEHYGPYLFHTLRRCFIPLPSQYTLPLHLPTSDFAFRWLDSPYFIHKVILSASPTSKDCILAAIFGKEEIAYCFPRSKAWIELEPGEWRHCHYNDIVFHGSELYAVDSTEHVWAFDVRKGSKRLVTKPGWGWRDDWGLNMRYLMVSRGKLIMVVREREELWNWRGITRFKRLRTTNMQVLELSCGSSWVQLGSLGDRVMFLGRSISWVVEGREVTLSWRLRPNCVYFTEDEITDTREPEDSGAFRMADRTVVRCGRGRGTPLFYYMFNYSSLL